MAETALLVKMRPTFQELRDKRTYTEPQVKTIMFHFARDLGCKWPEGELLEFIETVFDYD